MKFLFHFYSIQKHILFIFSGDQVGGAEEAAERWAEGAEVWGEQRQDEVWQPRGNHERGDRVTQVTVLKVQEGEGVVQGKGLLKMTSHIFRYFITPLPIGSFKKDY